MARQARRASSKSERISLPPERTSGASVAQERDFTYITAHFIGQEIDHLARMIRSRHWHRSAVWPVSYWRERIEELQHARAIVPAQRAGLRALLCELERIAAQLDSSAKPGEMPRVEAQASTGAGLSKARR